MFMNRIRIFGIIGLLLFTLAGCKGNPNEHPQENTASPTYANWREDGFVLKSISASQDLSGNGEDIYQETLFQEFENRTPDFTYETEKEATGYLNDKLYRFSSYQTEEEVRCFLDITPIGEEAEQRIEIQLPEEITAGYVLELDVISAQKQCVLFVGTQEPEGTTADLYVFDVDAQGNVENTRKLSEEFLQQEQETACSLFMVDEQGYAFLVNNQGNGMYAYDASGKKVLKREYTNTADTVRGGFHMPDGSVILLVGNYDTLSTELVWYDVSSMKPKVLQTLEGGDIMRACIAENGYVYYMKTSQIYAWNVSTGEQTKLFDCMFHGVDYNQVDALAPVSENKVALYGMEKGNYSVYIISDEEVPVEENGIRMAFLEYADPYVKLTTANFSRMYPDMTITIESNSGEGESYHDRIMAELVNGKGPDLLWVDVEDMQILYEKGAIEPLTDLISEDTLEQIFPGILESGSIDGKLVGVYFDSYPTAFVVNKELLGKDTWELADLNDVAEENPQLKGFMTSSFTFEEEVLLSILALSNLEDCPYLDWSNNKSNFNCEEFVSLLNYFKQYGPTRAGSLKFVCEGDYLAYRTSVDIKDLVGYSKVMAQCEDTCLLMGYPGSGQSEGCWMNSSFLVVNAASDNKEEISEFLEYAFSKVAQKECTLGSVRRDAIDSQVYIHEYLGTYVYGSGAQELELKANGETYLEDYLQFLDSCAPLPRSYEAISAIVTEEAELFFNGTYTAEQAAKNIDSRVQLYLDE